jgi:hypothetical protein
MISVQYRFVALFISGLMFLLSCAAPPKAEKDQPAAAVTRPPKLALTLKVASIDLFGLGRRIEKKDVEKFSSVLKKEQVEILAVQGITRYPNVRTRVDFVTELASAADMRHAFGETIDISGQQRGNAVFSMYPIRSNVKKEFDVPSSFLESALQVTVDAGVRDVRIVSTRFPEKATSRDITSCVQTLGGLQKASEGPFVAAGNFPLQRSSRGKDEFADVRSSMESDPGRAMTSRMWYVPGELFKLVSARTVKTELGTLTVVEFGLYQRVQP